jgi:hypothetical protein
LNQDDIRKEQIGSDNVISRKLINVERRLNFEISDVALFTFGRTERSQPTLSPK